MRTSLLLLGALAALISCTTAPVAPEALATAIAEAVPAPIAPPPLTVTIQTEPLGLRWTLYHPVVTRHYFKDDGRDATETVDAKNVPLGVHLGQGLFLDADGSLSLLPEALLAVPPAQSLAVHGALTGTVWHHGELKDFTVDRTKYEVVVGSSDVFGPKSTKVGLGLPTLKALGKVVTPRSDGGSFEVEDSIVPFLLVPTTFVPIDGGVQKKFGGLPPVDTTITTDGELTRASDGSLRITRLADHWQIKYLGNTWGFYQSADRGLVIDEVTGQAFRWKKTADGVEADGGWSVKIVKP